MLYWWEKRVYHNGITSWNFSYIKNAKTFSCELSDNGIDSFFDYVTMIRSWWNLHHANDICNWKQEPRSYWSALFSERNIRSVILLLLSGQQKRSKYQYRTYIFVGNGIKPMFQIGLWKDMTSMRSRSKWNTRAVISHWNLKIRNLTRTIFTKSLMSQSTIYSACHTFLIHDMKIDILMSSNFLVPLNSDMHKVFDEYKKNLFDFLTLRFSRVIAEFKWFCFRVQTKVLRDKLRGRHYTHRFEYGLIRTGNYRGLYLDWYTIMDPLLRCMLSLYCDEKLGLLMCK